MTLHSETAPPLRSADNAPRLFIGDRGAQPANAADRGSFVLWQGFVDAGSLDLRDRLAPGRVNLIVPQQGFDAQAGRGTLVANAMGMLLLDAGESCPIAVPACGSAFDAISMPPGVAACLQRLVGMAPSEVPSRPRFAQRWARLNAEDYLQLRVLQRAPGADPAHQCRVGAWVQRVLNSASHDWRKRPPAARHPASAEQGTAALAQRVARHLDRHWQRNVSLDELSDQFGLSPFHLLRGLRRSVGLTPHQYTLQLRLRQALIRLDRGGERLGELARDLGFSSHGHFSTAFRAAFGLTPAEYSGHSRTRQVAAPGTSERC